MIKLKSLIESVVAKGSAPYYYRIHPKGDIETVVRDGLWSYSPTEGPGSYVDAPEMGRWPDQDENDPQTYRFYVAHSEWKLTHDRFAIRIPSSNLNGLERDSLGDYYIDTDNESKQILEPNQFDIKVGGQWVRADVVPNIMFKYWHRAYKKPAGFYGNKYYSDGD